MINVHQDTCQNAQQRASINYLLGIHDICGTNKILEDMEENRRNQ